MQSLKGIFGGNNEKIKQITNMGFDVDSARTALEMSKNKVEDAVSLLLSQQSHSMDILNTNVTETRGAVQSNQTAASKRAGEAALARVENKKNVGKPKNVATLKNSNGTNRHQQRPSTNAIPINKSLNTGTKGLKIPLRLDQKPKEEQILRSVQRLSKSSKTVDILLKALESLKSDPSNPKFRTIHKTTQVYKNYIQNVPGAQDLLLAVNFCNERNQLVNKQAAEQCDMALLWMAISALEHSKNTNEYKVDKQKLEFSALVKDKIFRNNTATDNHEENKKRATFQSKLPPEPSNGGRSSVSLIHFHVESQLYSRKFDSDDQLADVLNWLGTISSSIPQYVASREWCIVDRNRCPVAPIDFEKHKSSTLQYAGFWPSGKLELMPSHDDWRGTNNNNGRSSADDQQVVEVMGSPRGLAAAKTFA